MICSALAMCPGRPIWLPHSRDTLKPVSPALGRAPRPVAPSSRISPPAPVAAPGPGEIAGGGGGGGGGGALVADLPAGAGGRAGPGRDRRGVVVRFHLHQQMLGGATFLIAVGVGM